MANEVTVKKNETLTSIVKREYGLKNQTDIMNTINLIKEKNKLKNINIIQIGQKLELPEQLRLDGVTIFGENGQPTPLPSSEKNYYRAVDVFGDTATKKETYVKQDFKKSTLNLKTEESESYVENVVVKLTGLFNTKTSRDAKMADIFAKQIGTWFKDGEQIGGGFALEQTDAYKFALEMNADDYTEHETEYKGKKEVHAYFDPSKSDKIINLFSTESVNGKKYIAMRDKAGKVHYFDKSNNLTRVPIDYFDYINSAE